MPPKPKKAAILKAAEKLFGSRGFARTSMDDIAAAAPVSKPTLYTHFRDKGDLFSAVIEARCAVLLNQMNSEINAEESPETALKRMGEIFLARILMPESIDLHRVIIAAAADFPDVAESFYGAGPARMEALVAKYLATQHGKKRLKVADPARAAETFLGILKGNTHMRHLLFLGRPADKKSLKKTVDYAVKTFLAAHRV